jgi:hypothetical protein
VWWDGALDDATLHLHFVEAILRGTCTWLSQLIIFQDDAALLQWVLGACSGGQVLHLQLAISVPHDFCWNTNWEGKPY